MFKPVTITAISLAFLFFILGGCKWQIQPLTEVTNSITGKAALEQKRQADKTLATIKCQELCQTKVATNSIISEESPCLSDEIIPDWVCDIAHSPRLPIDDESQNQCSAFRQGSAHHFVELDGNCNIIKVY